MSTGTVAAAPDTFVPVAKHWYVTNTGGLVMNGIVAVVTKRKTARWSFGIGVALHVGEAVYAYRSAQRAGFTESAPKWALQTLAVGFPSLIALHQAKQG